MSLADDRFQDNSGYRKRERYGQSGRGVSFLVPIKGFIGTNPGNEA
jgi:hypothetical protein